VVCAILTKEKISVLRVMSVIDTEKTINYEKLIDEVMYVLVKKALEYAQNNQLPGDHHFYISFLTSHPGVLISTKLKEKYPKEITIVLQYQFEELVIEKDKFSVVLTFNNIKERLVVPYIALTSFADPSVKFGLQFKQKDNFNKKSVVSVEKQEKTEDKEQEAAIEKPTDNVIALDKFRKK
jgi:uncharacterized protein